MGIWIFDIQLLLFPRICNIMVTLHLLKPIEWWGSWCLCGSSAWCVCCASLVWSASLMKWKKWATLWYFKPLLLFYSSEGYINIQLHIHIACQHHDGPHIFFNTNIGLLCLTRCRMPTWRWFEFCSESCLCSWWSFFCATGTAVCSILFQCWKSFHQTAGSDEKISW